MKVRKFTFVGFAILALAFLLALAITYFKFTKLGWLALWV